MEKNRNAYEAELLLIMRQFLLEQEAERAIYSVSLDASLERQLGVDSLAKVELFHRIEKTFGVDLPDAVMAEADTLTAIVDALLIAKPTKGFFRKEGQFTKTLDSVNLDLSKVNNLHEVLIQYALRDPSRPHIYLQDENDQETVITYGDLLAKSARLANGLIERGLRPDDTVAIMVPTSADFFQTFCGVLLAGGIPVPIYPPFRMDRIEEYTIREAKILNNAEIRFLVTFSQAERLGKILQSSIPSLKAVTTAKNLFSNNSAVPNIPRTLDQPALLQYTSGSTGDPKGILLCHKNILANIRSVAKAIEVDSTDAAVSWLPLYHDMGLMSWICSLYLGTPITILSPLSFLHRPERWLWAIHYHRGTLSAAPNFAYELCVKKIDDKQLEGLDLSSWRLCFNGAEAVNIQTLKRFYDRFKAYGLRKEALYPVYGLAENTVALAAPPINREFRIDRISKDSFEREKKALATNSDHGYLEFASEGMAIPDHQIRIVSENNQELAERQVGSVQFSGPSAMQGYYNNPAATAKVYHNGWWDTGDLGYIADGELYITGRKKDVIIKAGRNIYPETIEEVVCHVAGVRKGCAIAFGLADANLGTEKLIIVAESKIEDSQEQLKIANEITEQVAAHIGVPPDHVAIVPLKKIPKTSSGKLQRSACKEAYIKGELSGKSRGVKWQLAKLFFDSLKKRSFKAITNGLKAIYTLYAWALFAITILPAWALIMVLPKKMGYHIVRYWAKATLFLCFCPIKISGKDNLYLNSNVIYASNHGSYVDSLILLAVLPAGTLFVGKKEITELPLVANVARKLGFLTVDRWDFAQNIEDTKSILNVLQQNHSILIYPEGTFTYASGLRPFKPGTFQLSVDSKKPICPVTLQNTRKFWRYGSYLLTPTRIQVTACTPITPQGDDWREVIRLKTETRKVISRYSGEHTLDLITAGPEG